MRSLAPLLLRVMLSEAGVRKGEGSVTLSASVVLGETPSASVVLREMPSGNEDEREFKAGNIVLYPSSEVCDDMRALGAGI